MKLNAQGEAGIHERVGNWQTRKEGLAFLSCLMGVTKQGTVEEAHWVAGGRLEEGIGFRAKNIFPLADAELYMEVRGALDAFEFPHTSSNFSGYLEAPTQLSVVTYFYEEKKKEYCDWDKAKECGVTEFSVRLVVVPKDVNESFVQLAVAPMPLKHLQETYPEVYNAPYFPNTMIRCTKARTKLPSHWGTKTSMLAKEVELVPKDVEGLGLGIKPFFYGVDFDPNEEEYYMPNYQAIKEALHSFMRAGAVPVARTTARMPEALTVAMRADKDDANILPPVDSPWPAYAVGGRGGGGREG